MRYRFQTLTRWNRVTPVFLCVLAVPLWAEDSADLPKFAGPTDGVARTIAIPTVDVSGETDRHSIVAQGTPDTYHGHCDTVLLPDGKTMLTAWTVDHAQVIGPLARSTDGGRTWSSPLDVPANWHQTANTPAIHRLIDPQGKARLVVFGDGLDWRRKGKPPFPMHQAISEDDGETWTSMKPNGIQGEVPPKTILRFDDGRRLILWSDLPGYVVQSESRDGGQTWTPERRVLRIPDRWGQPCVIRSPDGKQLLMLLRENSRRYQSLYSVSNDDAKSWSVPRELPAALTGDRHVARYAPDGRLVVAMRDVAKSSKTFGHYVAWVGRYADIVEGREGQYRIKLLNNANRTHTDVPGKGNTDCGYSDLEVLPDGSFVATTYVKYASGPQQNSVVNTRFRLSEIDSKQTQAVSRHDNFPHPVKNPASPHMLDLVTTGDDSAGIDFATLPRVPSRHAMISDVRNAAGTRVHQHAYLAHFNDKYWAMWSDGPGVPKSGVSPEQLRNMVPGHDRPGTRVSYAASDDGLNWSPPADLSGPPRTPGFGWIARGLWVRNDELLALASHFNAPGYPGKGLSLEAFRWDPTGESWKPHGTVLNDTLNNFPPKRLPSGEFMMTRRDHRQQVSVIIGGVSAFNDWQILPLASYNASGRPEEPYWYVLPDGANLVGLIRDNGRSGRLLRTYSADNGRTWSAIVKTNFPDATSKFFVLRTSRGYYAMVSNANPKRRAPLTLAISKDGLVFTHLFQLVGGRHVDYPHLIEHDDHLLIAFSGAKQTMEVLKVSLDDVDAMIGTK